MSDSSSRESSPTRFRPTSPTSDDEHPAPGTSLSSSFYSTPFGSNSTASAAPILRQPVGFSWNAPSAPTLNTYSASLPAAPATKFLPGQEPPKTKKKKSAKGKDKEASASKSRAPSRKPKAQNATGKAPQAKANIPTPVLAAASTPLDFSSTTGGTTAFRVRGYVNEPTAVGSVIPQGKGPYTADYRVALTIPHGPSTHQPPPPASDPSTTRYYRPEDHAAAIPPPPPTATPQAQTRSYYRHDYEKERANAPARRARTAAPATEPTISSVPSTSFTTSFTSSQATPHPVTTPASSLSTFTSQQQLPTPSPVSMSDYSMGDLPEPSFEYSPVRSTPAPAQPEPTETSRRRSRKDRHRLRRSTEASAAQDSHHVPPPVPPPAPVPNVPPASTYPAGLPAPAVRYLRTLTLLIDDLRNGESQLAEVRIPLKSSGDSEDGFWADAKEVCTELQAGPSRIDGRAKVYAMRGKFKQYLMRVSSEGDIDSTTANVKVTKERTLEVFVEDNPIPGGAVTRAPPAYHAPFTPKSDSAHLSSSPALAAPRPMVPFSSFSDGINGSVDNYDGDAQLQQHRLKRRHSGGSQRSASVSEMSAVQQQNVQQQSEESSDEEEDEEDDEEGSLEAESEHQSTSIPSAQSAFAPENPMSSSRNSTPAFPFVQQGELQSHTSYDASLLPGPSQPKRPRHASSDTTFGGGNFNTHGRAWSLSMSSESTVQPSMTSGSTSMLSPTKMAGNIFGMPTPQSDASATPISHNSPAIPSLTVTGSGPSQAEIDSAVGKYLRSIVSQEPAWDAFVERRNSVLPMSKQILQYQYIKSTFDRFTSLATPADLKGAPNVKITPTHVLRAFNLPPSWGDECKEVLAFTAMYGRGGRRYEDPRAVAMFDEPPPISTAMQVQRYLTLLREIHGRWSVEHPEM